MAQNELIKIRLDDINRVYPGCQMLTRRQVCQYLKTDPRTLDKEPGFPWKKLKGSNRIVVDCVALAAWMLKGVHL